MAMIAGSPIDAGRVDRATVAAASSRTRDQLFCLELAHQATDVYFDRT